jgi:4-amino-4-deoxy-L-arabinose transferase-like glycosyltransferase
VLQATAYWPGILLYFAIAVPWYWLVQVRTGSFLRVFLLEHNLERFSTGVYHHTQPIWYFVPVMLVAVAPWTVLVLAGFVDAVRRSNIHSPASDEPDLDLLLVLWAALPFFFFSLSRSKLPGYILPSVPPSAMMAAIWLRRKMAAEEPLPRILTLMHALLAGGMLLVILLSPTLVLHLHPPPAAVTMATIAGALVFSTVFLAVRYRGTAILRFVTLVPVFLGLTFLLRIAAPVLDQGLSVRPLAREIAAVTPKNTVVAAYNIPRDVEYGLTFYFDQPIARYENHNVPEGDHALLSRDASEQQLDSLAPGRRFIPLGGLTHQDLVLYWVTEKAKY